MKCERQQRTEGGITNILGRYNKPLGEWITFLLSFSSYGYSCVYTFCFDSYTYDEEICIKHTTLFEEEQW